MYLLFGGESELGSATCRYLKESGYAVEATTRRRERVSPGRPFFDILSSLEEWQPAPGVDAACIFLAVARLRDCAADPAGSARINVVRTLALIDKLIAHGIYVLFLSSNQVFNGDVPCVAADAPTSPVSEYGRQKAETEAGIRRRIAQGAPLGVLRLSKILSPDLPLIQQWIKALLSGESIQAFNEMTAAPVPAALAAAAIAALLKQRLPGVYQLTGARDVSYAEIGCHLASELGVSPHLVEPVSVDAASMPRGSTPRHTTLDSSTLREKFGIVVPDVWQALAPIIKQAKAAIARQRGPVR